MAVLLALVFGILLLGWLLAALVFLASVTAAITWTLQRILGRPGRFAAGDAQFLRDLGIRP
jgi:hypothetical protein